jgi:four helix bundle protein
MSKHTTPSSHPISHQRRLPRGVRKLVALEVAKNLVDAIQALGLHRHRRLAHLRDQLERAADNTAIRLTEANGRTMGHRTQHLEAAYGENQEVQSVLDLIASRRIEIPAALVRQAHRLGGLIYGLLRADRSANR